MRWTIGMPSYNNFDEVYFTIQSLRLYHDLTDCEIVVVDNYGDETLEKFCREKGNGLVRYEKFNTVRGVSPAKNRIFEIARGDYVLCMDSHILLKAGALETLPPGDDLVQGPCLFNNMRDYSCEWFPQWRRNMWGIWAPSIRSLPEKPFEIWATGAGFFCCRRDSWLGFNPAFRGFGGESGYIQEKYRQAGRKIWCDPTKVWVHHFANLGRKIPYPIPPWERIRNYIIGFKELGLDVNQIKDHFKKNNKDGEAFFNEAMKTIEREMAREPAPEHIDNSSYEKAILKSLEIAECMDRPHFNGMIAHGNIFGR